MSIIENKLDLITNMFSNNFQWTLYTLPMISLPYLMSLYTYLQSTFTSTLKRIRVIKNAILETFDNEFIYYLHYDPYYIPFIHRKSRFLFLKGNIEWTYSVNDSIFFNHFTEDDEPQLYNINYIGASLRYYVNNSNYISIGDMSEWLLDQKVSINTKQIPLQVLVSAWAYSSGISLNHNYISYVVTIMDLEGNEHYYDLQHGVEYLPEDMKDHTEILSIDTIDTMTKEFADSQEPVKEGFDTTVVNETNIDEPVVDKSLEESINKLINESFEKELKENDTKKLLESKNE
jgi:hypothetical protein